MNNQILYQNIMAALTQRFPRKPLLTEALTDLLQIEKEAVYRRLRGDVPFSLSEVITLAKKLNISIDDILISDPVKSIPFQLKMAEYIDPTDTDYMMMQNLIQILDSLRSEPQSEGGEATTLLPQPIYLAYEHITKFYIFKWKYSYDSINNGITPYNKITLDQRFQKLRLDNMKVAKNISVTDYIFDNMLFQYLVNDLKYFNMIRLVTDEEVLLIKQDLLAILDELETLAQRGYFLQTGNKINLYISSINFPTNYCYIETPNFHLTMVKAFTLYTIASLDDNIFDKLKNWMQSLKQQSILITQSGERERILYFEKQKEIINQL